MEIHVKRVYSPPEEGDGKRILVDRLWPRGVRKEDAAVDVWLKEIAPSPELRKSFSHDPELFPWFRKQYTAELTSDAVRSDLCNQIRAWAAEGPVTLLYSARDPLHNNVVVLRDVLIAGDSSAT